MKRFIYPGIILSLVLLVVLGGCGGGNNPSGSSWKLVGSAGFSAGLATCTSIAIDGSGVPYVVYGDFDGNNIKATVMKFIGTTWTPVGSAGFSAGHVVDTSIAIDGNGVPYVAYRDVANNFKATVMKCTGTGLTGWTSVGNVGFSGGSASYTSIAIDRSVVPNVPYVVYRDDANYSKATVMKYTVANGWNPVGSVGFSVGLAEYTSIAIDESGTPYVVYQDNILNSSKVAVMKFDGANWISVGDTAGLSAGGAEDTSIAIDGSGVPYVVYSGNLWKATVIKYTGVTEVNPSGWTSVGDAAGFSAGQASYTSIAIDSSGVPFVVYNDGENNFKATVMKYTGTGTTGWTAVGNAGLSAGQATYTSIAIDGNGVPYVAYRDGGNYFKATVMKYAP